MGTQECRSYGKQVRAGRSSTRQDVDPFSLQLRKDTVHVPSHSIIQWCKGGHSVTNGLMLCEGSCTPTLTLGHRERHTFNCEFSFKITQRCTLHSTLQSRFRDFRNSLSIAINRPNHKPSQKLILKLTFAIQT